MLVGKGQNSYAVSVMNMNVFYQHEFQLKKTQTNKKLVTYLKSQVLLRASFNTQKHYV